MRKIISVLIAMIFILCGCASGGEKNDKIKIITFVKSVQLTKVIKFRIKTMFLTIFRLFVLKFLHSALSRAVRPLQFD